MKRLLLAVLGIALLSFAGCGSDQTEPETDISEPSVAGPDEQLYTQAAANLVGQYGRALRDTLQRALAESGTLYALDICQLKVPVISSAYAASGWSIKRVSDKHRNPTNRPDTTEVSILAKFADTAASPDDYMFAWSETEDQQVFHYYKKIMVRQNCLRCHGDLQTIDQNLYKSVKMRYPWDKATGYRVGDLRGMFAVTATWPEGKEMARLLAEGADFAELTASIAGSTSDSTATVAEDSTADSL